METIKINKETLTFNKIWYVDAVNGNDTTGDGGVSNPYKTIIYTLTRIDTEDCIKLSDGLYNFTTQYTMTKSVTIIGNNENTIIQSNLITSSTLITLSIYNLVWKYMNRFFNSSAVNFHAYNCVIEVIPSGYQSNYFFYSSSSGLRELNNCLLYTNNTGTGIWDGTVIIGGTSINLINSYYKDRENGTQRYTWTYSVTTSLIRDTLVNSSSNLNQGSIGAPSVDEKYNITSLGWQNTGTGLNPDGTQAHIGVYGGPFAWGEWSNFIPVPFTLHKNTSNVSSIYSIDADVTDRLSVQYEGVRLIPSMEIQIKSKITPRPDEEDVLIRSWSSTLVNTLDNFSLDRYSDSLYKVVSSGLSVGEITASLGGVTLLRVHEGGFSWTIPLPAPSGNETWELSGSSTPFIESEKTIRDFNIPEAGNYTRNEGSTYIAESALGMANEVELPTVVGEDYTYVAPFSSAGMSPWNLKEVTK